MSHFRFPRNAFKAYKSAEVHTKQKFKLPWFVWIPVALVPLAAWAVPKAYTNLHGSMTGKGIERSAPAPAAPASVPVPAGAPAGFIPQGSNVTPSSPVPPLQPIPQAALAKADISGCIKVRNRCSCFTSQGKKADVEPAYCLDNAGTDNQVPMQLANR